MINFCKVHWQPFQIMLCTLINEDAELWYASTSQQVWKQINCFEDDDARLMRKGGVAGVRWFESGWCRRYRAPQESGSCKRIPDKPHPSKSAMMAIPPEYNHYLSQRRLRVLSGCSRTKSSAWWPEMGRCMWCFQPWRGNPGLPMWPHNRGGSGKHNPSKWNQSVLFYHPKESLVSTWCRFASTQR